jgi:Spy/CpxP family protein refolding chaperone
MHVKNLFSMLSVRCGSLGLMLGAGIGVVACGGGSARSAPATSATSSPADDETTADLTEHHRYHHHGGITLFIAMSLDTLGVSPEQQAGVERIRRDLYARMEPARAAEQNLTATLANGIATGSVDTAAVDAALAQLVVAAAAVQAASAVPLNDLHALLTPPERVALVDKVQAHWAVWQKANADQAGAVQTEGDYFTRLATDLGLTAEQVGRIRAGLADESKAAPPFDPQEVSTVLVAFGDAFRGDHFDAVAFTTARVANAHMVGWAAAHMAHFLEAVSPVLTADQRANLAQRLSEHASHNPSAEASP